MQIGIDTSVLIGLMDPRDKWHSTAVALKQALHAQDAVITVFDCTLAEAISTILRRLQEQRRITDLESVLQRLTNDYPLDGIFWTLPGVPDLYIDILNLIRSSRGKLNFNDALIALTCRNEAIAYLASFDQDFDQITWLKRISHSGDLSSIMNSSP